MDKQYKAPSVSSSNGYRSSRNLVFSALILVAASIIACSAPPKTGQSNVSSSPSPSEAPANSVKNSQGITYVPADPNAYVPGKTIQEWADTFQDDKIRGHSFQLWAAITARTGQIYSVKDSTGTTTSVDLAVFDTWFDEFEVFDSQPTNCAPPDSCKQARHYHQARQTATGAPSGGAEVISFNKYSIEFKDYVEKYHYNEKQTLVALNQKFIRDNTPLEKRTTEGVADQATMLKPSFWVIKRDRPTPMPYWKGTGDTIAGTTDPDRPVVATWEQIVVVDPTGKAKPGEPYTVPLLTKNGFIQKTYKDYKILGVDQFYAVPLSQSDVDYIRAGKVFNVWGLKSANIEVGDLALLVAMHVTTAETGPWTWQTFFWRPDAVADSPASVKGPFRYFDTVETYYFMNKDGTPKIGFNPYLETPIEGPIFMNPQTMRGSHSNCMTCHHAAAFPTMNQDPSPAFMLQGSYVGTGTITGKEQWFKNRVKTHFMWGMVLQNQSKPDAPAK